jgi:hypothetical protein
MVGPRESQRVGRQLWPCSQPYRPGLKYAADTAQPCALFAQAAQFCRCGCTPVPPPQTPCCGCHFLLLPVFPQRLWTQLSVFVDSLLAISHTVLSVKLVYEYAKSGEVSWAYVAGGLVVYEWIICMYTVALSRMCVIRSGKARTDGKQEMAWLMWLLALVGMAPVYLVLRPWSGYSETVSHVLELMYDLRTSVSSFFVTYLLLVGQLSGWDPTEQKSELRVAQQVRFSSPFLAFPRLYLPFLTATLILPQPPPQHLGIHWVVCCACVVHLTHAGCLDPCGCAVHEPDDAQAPKAAGAA